MRTVYLVNPISGHGHLDSYARLYARALVELGLDVVLLAPEDGGTADYLRRNASSLSEGTFHFQSFDHLDSELYARLRGRYGGLPFLARARAILKEEGAAGITRRLTYHAARLVSKVSPDLARLLGLTHFTQKSRIPFTSFPARLALAEELTDAPRDFVIFLYLDFMAQDAASLRALNNGIGPWAGILFHPKDDGRLTQQGPERYLLATSAKGLILLVPEAVGRYQAAVPAVRPVVVPDVADLETGGSASPVLAALKAKANGRKIVLQIGVMTPHKGVQDHMDVIAMADPARFCFAFVGRLYDEAFGSDADAVRRFFDNPPENVFVHDGFIDDEREYNSILAAADIAFAVYRDFPSSSNILTKAAEFRVPLLVSERYLMGRTVAQYNTGLAVKEAAPDVIHQALLLATERSWPEEGFNRFAADRSLLRLKTVLQEALNAWQ